MHMYAYHNYFFPLFFFKFGLMEVLIVFWGDFVGVFCHCFVVFVFVVVFLLFGGVFCLVGFFYFLSFLFLMSH